MLTNVKNINNKVRKICGSSSSSSIFNVNIITPTSEEDILIQLFHQCISHESNAWWKRCVFRPDLKTGKEQGARMREMYSQLR